MRRYAVETGSHGGLVSASDGSLKLFCEKCYHYSDISEIVYYGYCDYCWTLTPIEAGSERADFVCSSCGQSNTDSAVYMACPFRYCGELLRVEPLEEGEEERIMYGSSSGVRELDSNSNVNVLYISGILYKGRDGNGDTFEFTGMETGQADIDSVDIDIPSGSCAFLIEDSDGAVRSSLYFYPVYFSTGEPPKQLDRVAVRYCLRLPENAKLIKFYNTVPGNDEREGWMEFGGWQSDIFG